VRNTLEALETAAQERSLSAFMEHISKDYSDHRGNTWKDIQRLVQFQYIRHTSIFIFSDITSLVVEADAAAVEINVTMAARASDLESSAARLRADNHQFSVLLKKSDDLERWLVSSVSWQQGWQ
jgi:hypothetical protein